MDASKALQALVDGDNGQLLAALGTDECTVVSVPGHDTAGYITVARIGTYVVTAQGPMIQGAQFDDTDTASGIFAELVADCQAWASEHVCPASDAYDKNPLLADLGALLQADTITGGMF